jgi:ABC-type branched-subunit amino acid transport system ATPase component
MGTPADVLVTIDVSVAFGALRALDGVSLRAEAGEIVGVVGANGAGKTTFFDALSGLVAATGSIVLDGVEIAGHPTHRRAAAGLGRSFQDARLFGTLTVADTLRVASERRERQAGVVSSMLRLPNSRSAERAASDRAAETIELLGLGDYRERLVRELSTGTRRIVDLGCALVQRPKVLLLDEPSSGIAQREAEALGPLLLRIRADLACTLIVIEHDMPLVLTIADRLYALEVGRVIAHGEPRAVLRHPAVVRSYLGGDITAVQRSGATQPTRRPRRAG